MVFLEISLRISHGAVRLMRITIKVLNFIFFIGLCFLLSCAEKKSEESSTVTPTVRPLAITPAKLGLAVNNHYNFATTGGTSPYSYVLYRGFGSVDATTGEFTAPSFTGSATVRVTDALGEISESVITINAALVISPAIKNIPINGTQQFTFSGGVEPIRYTVVSGSGIVNVKTGFYTAPATAGAVVIRATDGVGNIASANVTVYSQLLFTPSTVTLAVNNTNTFAASGGALPYTYSLVSGGGSINASTGVYTAPATSGTATVRVTDATGSSANATVTINPALAISPTTQTIITNSTLNFSATGGVSPYSYSVVSGVGSINSSSGVFSAGSTPGSSTVRVTDAKGNISEATVTVNPGLSLSSAGGVTVISQVDTLGFSASGGFAAYTYSIFSGPGTINSSSGLYTAVTSGAVTVRVTDSTNATSDFAITVNPSLTIFPASAYVPTESDFTVNGVDGVPPYTYSLVSGAGTIDDVTGIYTADINVGTAVVRVTDSMNHTADSTLTLYNSLSLSPLDVTMAVSDTQNFTATGGYGALTFSIVSGLGSIDSSGVFTASASGGPVVIRVEDTIGNSIDANIDVVSTLTISPQTLNLPVFSTAKFTSILGTAPYTYSVLSGTGSVVAGTGVYTGQATAGVGTVQLEDAATNTSVATITHITPVEIVSGAAHSCVRYSNGQVKCWGLGSSGQLGNNSTANIGSTSSQVGSAIPFLDLGTGRTAIALAAGLNHTCAILDNHNLKCWGSNTYGQLGYGNTTSYGSASGQMGNNLPVVSLGAGRTAAKVFAFGYMTCVILDTNATKCFGRNTYGQLGLDDTTNRGSAGGQMGDSLPAVNLGIGRTATKIVGGQDYTCALLDNAKIKCFGRAVYGQTGYESTATTGNVAGSMAALAYVDLGTGRTVIDIAAGYSHVCAVLDNNTIKCWGRNQSGQLGYGNITTYGDSVGDMANNLPTVPLTSFTAVKVWAGRQWSCAANSSNAIRCWGYNSTGQLMVGSTSSLGDAASEVANLTNINFGTGVVVSSLSLGNYFGCAIMTNDRIKCFGSAASNALLNASTAANLGDSGAELGDGLPWVNH